MAGCAQTSARGEVAQSTAWPRVPPGEAWPRVPPGEAQASSFSESGPAAEPFDARTHAQSILATLNPMESAWNTAWQSIACCTAHSSARVNRPNASGRMTLDGSHPSPYKNIALSPQLASRPSHLRELASFRDANIYICMRPYISSFTLVQGV